MPPTLVHVDGFELQQYTSGAGFQAGGTQTYNVVANAAAETTVVRTGAASLALSPTVSAAGDIAHLVSAGNRVGVESFYVRLPSLPSSDLNIALTVGPSNAPHVGFQASSGKFGLRHGTSGALTVFGPVVEANRWYLVDWMFDVSAATFTGTARIDGDAGTQATATRTLQTPADFVTFRLGTTLTTGPAATIYYDDWIFGHTLAEYPYGPHTCRLLKPTGDGTHNAGTNVMEDNALADIGAVTAFNLIDELPPENTDFIRQSASGSGNYAEVSFANPAAADLNIWGATAWCAVEGVSGSGTSGLIFRVVDSSNNTLLDQGTATTTLSALTRRYSVQLVPPPGGAATWSAEPSGDLSGVKGRIGFSTDVAPIPAALTFVLQYAAPTGSETFSGVGIPIS